MNRARIRRAVAAMLGAEQRVDAYQARHGTPEWTVDEYAKLWDAYVAARDEFMRESSPRGVQIVLDALDEAERYIAKLRGPLLHYFGTTDPELLAEVWRDQAKPVPQVKP